MSTRPELPDVKTLAGGHCFNRGATNMNKKSASSFYLSVQGFATLVLYYFYAKHIVKGQRRDAGEEKKQAWECQRRMCTCACTYMYIYVCACVCDHECKSMLCVCLAGVEACLRCMLCSLRSGVLRPGWGGGAACDRAGGRRGAKERGHIHIHRIGHAHVNHF